MRLSNVVHDSIARVLRDMLRQAATRILRAPSGAGLKGEKLGKVMVRHLGESLEYLTRQILLKLGSILFSDIMLGVGTPRQICESPSSEPAMQQQAASCADDVIAAYTALPSAPKPDSGASKWDAVGERHSGRTDHSIQRSPFASGLS
jgi:hypothetical protein